MKSVLLGVVAVVLIGSASACGDPVAPLALYQPAIIDVEKLEAPAAIIAGQPISVVLTLLTGWCLKFERFEVHRNATGAIVTAWGREKIMRKNEACPDIGYLEQHTLVLGSPFQDAYTVVVNRPRHDPLTARVEVR